MSLATGLTRPLSPPDFNHLLKAGEEKGATLGGKTAPQRPVWAAIDNIFRPPRAPQSCQVKCALWRKEQQQSASEADDSSAGRFRTPRSSRATSPVRWRSAYTTADAELTFLDRQIDSSLSSLSSEDDSLASTRNESFKDEKDALFDGEQLRTDELDEVLKAGKLSHPLPFTFAAWLHLHPLAAEGTSLTRLFHCWLESNTQHRTKGGHHRRPLAQAQGSASRVTPSPNGQD